MSLRLFSEIVIENVVVDIIAEKTLDLNQELVNFLMINFVKKEMNINLTIPEFNEMFGIKYGKNIFTKELNKLGIRHYKCNDAIKYNLEDVKRVIIPLRTEPEKEPEEEPEVEPEEENPDQEEDLEGDILDYIDTVAEYVEIKTKKVINETKLNMKIENKMLEMLSSLIHI
jgi:hypothetical protein